MPVMVTVELFGVPRILAGQRRLCISPCETTLAAASAALATACPRLVGKVLDPATGWLLDGYQFAVDELFTRDPTYHLEENASLLLVASAAGG